MSAAVRVWRIVRRHPLLVLLGLAVFTPRRVRHAIAANVAALVAPLLVAAHVLARPGWWVFDDVWDWVAGAAHDIWGLVKEGVKRIVDIATNLLTDWANWLFGIVWDSFYWVYRRVDDVVGWLWAGINQVYGWVGWFVGTVADGIWWSVNQAFGWLQWLQDAAWSWFQYALDFAWSQTQGAISWVLSQVWNVVRGPVEWLVQGAINAANFLFGIVRDVVCTVENFVRMLLGKIGDALTWIFDVGQKVAGVVLKAFEWLVWFARHPFTWFRMMADDLFSRGGRWLLERMTVALATEGSTVERFLARWLGL